MRFDDPLPIDDIISGLQASLNAHTRAVLVAPPGAGKTTRVPLALRDEPWVRGKRILILEPRRLAARAAAQRMASTLGEQVGDTIGLRVRLESKVSARTQIEVITEGVFTRMVMDDPSLEGIAAVLFDEFHERSLDADLGLALALDAQTGLREDLRLLIMSATLDGARIAGLLGDAPVLTSEGRAFPVDTRYAGRDPRGRIEDDVVRAVTHALASEVGSLLVFLPGQSEITRVAKALDERLRDPNVDIVPLYGAMERGAQDKAVSPAAKGRRKIVLATSIAETSLTIEGVRVVIDCGLARVPRYEPDLGLTRLETVRVSRAAADQRRGRAGRTEPGVCIRLWDEAGTAALPAFAAPEILSADLSGLLLDLAVWGVRDPLQLTWLDPPPGPATAEARNLLKRLGALDSQGAVTPTGRAMRSLPLPPRLARMVLEGAALDAADLAADIAVVLVERGAGGDAIDLADRVERLRRDQNPRAKEARQLARGWARIAKAEAGARGSAQPSSLADDLGALLALAYPDRIAKARGKAGEFVMANGRAAAMEPHVPLARHNWIAIAEIAGKAGSARILAAASLDPAHIEIVAGDTLEVGTEIFVEPGSLSLKSRRYRRLGAILLADQPQPVPETLEAANMLALAIARAGIDRLPWTKAQIQRRDRVMFLRNANGSDHDEQDWPDLSDKGLASGPERWLAPFIIGRSSLTAIQPEDLAQALDALLPWDLSRRLDLEAPSHFAVPTGSEIALDYEAEGGPVLAVRVQELYGLSKHPTIAAGRIPLTLHLLSPAHRPIQITRDLPGFWRGSWSEVRSELKGRYPRHLWPEDPARALPTTRAKPRGT